jgi:hypothetical protein
MQAKRSGAFTGTQGTAVHKRLLDKTRVLEILGIVVQRFVLSFATTCRISTLWFYSFVNAVTLRTLRSKVREKEIADGASTVSFVTTLSSYFLTDFPSNLICSFMVWVRCRAEPCKLDGSTAQTIGTNLGRVAERERSVGGSARAHPHRPFGSPVYDGCYAGSAGRPEHPSVTVRGTVGGRARPTSPPK